MGVHLPSGKQDLFLHRFLKVIFHLKTTADLPQSDIMSEIRIFQMKAVFILNLSGMEELINLESARNLQAGQTTTMNLKLRMIKSCLYFYHFQDFKASWRGLNLRMMPSLKSRDVIEIGLFLSDKKQGKFKLEISEISAMTEESFKQYLNSSLSLKSTIERVKHDANQLELRFETSANFNYKIESSSDLTNWKNYQTVPGTGETINYFLKNDAMNKFYRIRASAK